MCKKIRHNPLSVNCDTSAPEVTYLDSCFHTSCFCGSHLFDNALLPVIK